MLCSGQRRVKEVDATMTVSSSSESRLRPGARRHEPGYHVSELSAQAFGIWASRAMPPIADAMSHEL
jgi:hypothetical protein